VPWADDAVVEAGTGPKRGHWDREERGVEFSRIVAFSDGVFAIAITLLVLNLHLPEHIRGDQVFQALLDQQGDLIAYAISFAVIGRLWMVHHQFFGEVTHFDDRLMAINLAYLAFVVLIPFTSEVLGDHGDTTAGVIIYAVNLLSLNLLGSVMFRYAARAGLTVERFRRYVDQPLRMRNLTTGLVFAASIPVAVLAPNVAIAMWVGSIFLPGERIDEPAEP
jgi:TMEM175 potassium channel family protein